jgi:hypothetical protein
VTKRSEGLKMCVWTSVIGGPILKQTGRTRRMAADLKHMAARRVRGRRKRIEARAGEVIGEVQ